MPIRLRRRAKAAAACAAALLALVVPAAAQASHDAEVSIMDDQLLFGKTDAKVESAMQKFENLGVDRLRVSAFWRDHAPAPTAKRKPAGFDGANGFSPAYNWTDLDRIAIAAGRHGIKLLISISTPAPIWATSNPSAGNPVLKPDVTEFAAYAHAVAQRYGSVADQYAILNEPNQPSWLQPQTDSRGLVAPHHYRNLVRAAYPRIKAVDPSATVLIGELASGGRAKHGAREPLRPLEFLRAMGCVDRGFHSIRSGRCANFKPVPLDAVGHHPYSFYNPPTTPLPNRDDAGIGDSHRLLGTIDRLVSRGRLNPSQGRPDVYYTEFGYQTNPPDPFAGIALSRQDRWLQDAAYLVWRTPRIKALNQFRLTDGALRNEPGFEAFHEFQSGLQFSTGKAKPAFRSFPHPFVISPSRPRRGSKARAWGQVRPGGAHKVTVEFRSVAARSFKPMAMTKTDGLGYFTAKVTAEPGFYRYRYSGGGVPPGETGPLALATR
jgi:hypothetical protein